MSETARNIIHAALYEIGFKDPGESVTSDETTFCLDKFNRLVDQWNAIKEFIYYFSHDSYAWAASQQSYTIGPTGDFVAARPVKIIRANVILVSEDPDRHQPLNVIEVEDYARLAIPTDSAQYPHTLYYQPTVPNTTLWPYPYPTTVTDKLELFTWSQFSAVTSATLDTSIDLAPGYEEALVLTLAEKFGPPLGRMVSMDLANQARHARSVIASINLKAPKLKTRESGIPTAEAW